MSTSWPTEKCREGAVVQGEPLVVLSQTISGRSAVGSAAIRSQLRPALRRARVVNQAKCFLWCFKMARLHQLPSLDRQAETTSMLIGENLPAKLSDFQIAPPTPIVPGCHCLRALSRKSCGETVTALLIVQNVRQISFEKSLLP